MFVQTQTRQPGIPSRLFLLCLLLSLPLFSSSAQFAVTLGAPSNGAGWAEDGQYVLTGIVGQTVSGTAWSDEAELDGGFFVALPFLGQAVAAPLDPNIPAAFALEQNYPNPFNNVTQIRYALPRDAHVNLIVYTSLGQLVATVVDDDQPAGYHTATFVNPGLASGVYFYRLHAGEYVATRKLMLLK